MVQINSKYQFKVYTLDTQKTILSRIAALMNTTPIYLYLSDGFPEMEEMYTRDKNVSIENLLEKITSTDNSFDFIPLFESIREKVKKMGLNLEEDVLKPFIVYNNTITTTDDDMRGALLYAAQTEIDNFKPSIFQKKVDVQRIWDERDIIRQNLENSIKLNKKQARDQEKDLLRFEKIATEVKSTEFEMEQVRFEFNLNIEDISIMEVFNHIQLSPVLPFASINNTYKILKNFLPSEDWQYTLEDTITFKILQKKDTSYTKFSDYSDMFLFTVEENDKKVFKVISTLFTSGQYLNREELIDRFTRVIQTVKKTGEIIKKDTVTENKVKGVIYFPQRSINKYVLSDIFMNNTLFSRLFSVDEREKASKEKESIYIHFVHPVIGEIKASITSKISVRGEQELKGKNVKTDFAFGTSYIRVKISRAENIKAVSFFKDMLSKLFIIYEQEHRNIIEFYREFIPDFAKDKVQKQQKPYNLKLKDIAPEVFVQGYPSSCTKQPSVIDDAEVEAEEAKGKIVMRYPIDGTEGVQPRNYVCNHEKAIYPGLRSNSLVNKNTVPYLPCCYEKDHSTRKGSIFRHYYFGEPLADKTNMEQQDLIITNKFVPKDKYGLLPEDISKIFEIFDYNTDYIYVRKGVFDTKSSFLDCVLEGLYDKTNVLNYNTLEKRRLFLRAERKKMATTEKANLCRQEMYDNTSEEIKNIISNPNIYMKPKLFLSLLEEIYDCNIYIFNRDSIRSGQLALPRYLHGYYKNVRKSRSVFIYEHMGSVSDRAEYPRCELIVRWKVGSNKEEDVSYYTPYGSNLSLGVRKLFNRMTKSYALNKPVLQTVFPIRNKKVELVSQSIDSYGKTRMLNFKYKNKLGTMLTTPIQPFALPDVSRIVNKMNIELAVELASILRIRITGQTVINKRVKEIHGSLGTVKISLPVEDANIIEGVPLVQKGLEYTDSNISALETYNMYKKLSRYIVDYCYWLFSRYLYGKKSTNMSLDTIQEFRREKITIKEDFVYGPVEKSFSLDSGVMFAEKLVLKSEETLKRILYILRLAVVQMPETILTYHTRKVIENYYVDITDFDQYNFQVILKGADSVEKWIKEQKLKYLLYDSVQPEKQTPYFFYNKLVGSQIYLAQNTDSIQKAVKIAEKWQIFGYNIGNNPDITQEKLPSFTLYSYVHPKNIREYKFKGDSDTEAEDTNIRVIGYKVNDNSYFTTLLSL